MKGETSGTKVEKKVLFKPIDTESIGLKLSSNDHSEILDELTKRLANLGLKDDKKKSIVPLTMELVLELELESSMENSSNSEKEEETYIN